MRRRARPCGSFSPLSLSLSFSTTVSLAPSPQPPPPRESLLRRLCSALRAHSRMAAAIALQARCSALFWLLLLFSVSVGPVITPLLPPRHALLFLLHVQLSFMALCRGRPPPPPSLEQVGSLPCRCCLSKKEEEEEGNEEKKERMASSLSLCPAESGVSTRPCFSFLLRRHAPLRVRVKPRLQHRRLRQLLASRLTVLATGHRGTFRA